MRYSRKSRIDNARIWLKVREVVNMQYREELERARRARGSSAYKRGELTRIQIKYMRIRKRSSAMYRVIRRKHVNPHFTFMIAIKFMSNQFGEQGRWSNWLRRELDS